MLQRWIRWIKVVTTKWVYCFSERKICQIQYGCQCQPVPPVCPPCASRTRDTHPSRLSRVPSETQDHVCPSREDPRCWLRLAAWYNGEQRTPQANITPFGVCGPERGGSVTAGICVLWSLIYPDFISSDEGRDIEYSYKDVHSAVLTPVIQ
jgi:hypothetical protein